MELKRGGDRFCLGFGREEFLCRGGGGVRSRVRRPSPRAWEIRREEEERSLSGAEMPNCRARVANSLSSHSPVPLRPDLLQFSLLLRRVIQLSSDRLGSPKSSEEVRGDLVELRRKTKGLELAGSVSRARS